jgi:hypothetical protein
MMINRVISKIRRDANLFITDAARSKARHLVNEGQNHLESSALEEALDCARRALKIDADFNDAYHLMAAILMPGDTYMTLLARFHESLQPDAYLEIGVSTGASLELAQETTKAIGIDPHPRISQPIRARARLYPITSDEFFERYDLLHELAASRLPMAFIDGLHTFEQVLKDFINVERFADSRTVVLVHDCLPIARILATREPTTNLWCGDVWKIVPILLKYRSDLNVNVIPTQPSGLALITNLDPTSTTLRDNFDQIVVENTNQVLDYDYLDLVQNKLPRRVPSVVPNDWERLSAMISN